MQQAWSPVAPACSSVEQGLGSQAEAGPIRSAETTRSQPLDQWSVTRALALQLCWKEFPPRRKAVKQVKWLLGREYSVCGQTQGGLGRRGPELHPRGSFNRFMGHFFQFPSSHSL